MPFGAELRTSQRTDSTSAGVAHTSRIAAAMSRAWSVGGEPSPGVPASNQDCERGDRYERGTRITGQTKLFTMPMSVAAPAARAALTSSSLSKSPDPFVSNAATAAE